ncbi:MAG: hypothetical protein HFI32_15375 [Lachnospiraceae bacterium]|nr:hypothetical protein [Lachnospiraceae bacterium]
MKKEMKRWLALLLAVVIVTTTCVFSSENSLFAFEEGETEEAMEVAEEPVDEPEVIVVPSGEVNQESDEPAAAEEPTQDNSVQPEESTPAPEEPAQPEESAQPEASAPEKEQVQPEANAPVEKPVQPETKQPADTTVPEETAPEKEQDVEAEETEEQPEEEDVPEEETSLDEKSKSNIHYEIHYYYDGTEDENSRTVGEDGVLGEKIPGSDNFAQEVTFGEKNYVLDHVENEAGQVTEKAESNVVKVYYALLEEEEQEVKKPAQTLTAVAEDGAKVTVVAPEGALPEGSKVTIKELSASSYKSAVEAAVKEEGKQLTDLKVYDITILDADGNEIQPDNTVKVTITGADVKGTESSVYHMEDNGPTKVADEGNAQFVAEHFSPYVVTGEEPLADDMPLANEEINIKNSNFPH